MRLTHSIYKNPKNTTHRSWENMKTILVTGSAGFIGFHMAQKLLDSKYHVVGIDNLNNYYDHKLKQCRQDMLQQYDEFTSYNVDLNEPGFYMIFSQNIIQLMLFISLHKLVYGRR